jgi:hypothetical protein
MSILAAVVLAQFGWQAPAVTAPETDPRIAACSIVNERIDRSMRFDFAGFEGAPASETSFTSKPQGKPAAQASKATYLLNDENFHDKKEVGWEGFLYGLQGFEHFYNPVGQPIYFETALNESALNLVYMNHTISKSSQFNGGQIDVAMLQARVAMTDRLGFMIFKDGYSWLHSGAFAHDNGTNDLGLGVKYVAVADTKEDFLVTPGFRWMLENGSKRVLQGSRQEYSPFVSIAKGFDKIHLMGHATWRFPEASGGNQIAQWDVHADYEVAKGIAPLVELHGLHYLTDGDDLNLSAGYLDLGNIGAMHVAGQSVYWAGLGARARLTPNLTVGSVFEMPISNPHDDVLSTRFTISVELKW